MNTTDNMSWSEEDMHIDKNMLLPSTIMVGLYAVA